MIIAKNDEEKRSRIWRATFAVSSVLIVVIAVYLLTKLFTTNPLEGHWESDDGSYEMTISADSGLTVRILELSENENIDIEMDYVIDKDEKTITIHLDEDTLDKIAEASDGSFTKEMLESAISPVATTFDYSVDNDRLTLTEREYGDQMVFTKK